MFRISASHFAIVFLVAGATSLPGHAQADTLTGNALPNFLVGRQVATNINGRGGNDILWGDAAAGNGTIKAVRRISTTTAGLQLTNGGTGAALSRDGRKIFFTTMDSLVFGDSNGLEDVYERDLGTGAIRRVSVAASGTDSNGVSGSFNRISASADGNLVAFSSNASNLVLNDVNGDADIFVKNMTTGAVTCVSNCGQTANTGASYEPMISSDGTLVVFSSFGRVDSDGKDTNLVQDIFVTNLKTDKIKLVSTALDLLNPSNPNRIPANNASSNPTLSPDGKRIAYTSLASNIVRGDENLNYDVFVTEIAGLATDRVSLPASNLDTNGASNSPVFSPNGNSIAFVSTATNLDSVDFSSGIGISNIFIKNLVNGGVKAVSRSSTGITGDSDSISPVFSPDGLKIAFTSRASNFFAAGGDYRLYLKDLRGGATGALSVIATDPGGTLGAGEETYPAFSGDGTRIAYTSSSSSIVGGDTNGVADVFLARLATVPSGKDRLIGGAGRDRLFGAGNNDLLTGGLNTDEQTGGNGADRFVFTNVTDSPAAAPDKILDFSPAERDVIDLSAIDANSSTAPNDRFTYIGARPFSGTPGELRFANGQLTGDTNGNRRPDIVIRLPGLASLPASALDR